MSVVRMVAVGICASISLVMACSSGDTPGERESAGELAYELSGTVTISAVHSGKCLGVSGSSNDNGAQIQQVSCSNKDSKRFTLRDVGGGQHELRAVSSGKCVDVSEVSQANGAVVHQWDCVGGANQRWFIQKQSNGQYELKAVHSGKCLDVADWSQSNGARLVQWDCTGGSNQRFVLNGVKEATGTGGSSSTGGSTGTSGSGSTAGSGNTAGTGNTAGAGGTPATGCDAIPSSSFQKANLTNFESYPDPGSDECVNYNGCTWAGYFAGVEGKQSEDWVRSHNILAVHSKDFSKYKLKSLCLRQGSKRISATVYDMCSDSDCDGCCTRNAGGPNGFLIDIEKYTQERFGSGSGVVDWACLDCK